MCPIKKYLDKTGWLICIGLVACFFLLGQWYILRENALILGIYSTFTALIVFYFLKGRPKRAVPLFKALVMAAALIIYNWVLNWTSANWCLSQAYIKYLPVLAGMLLVFAVHSPLIAHNRERLVDEISSRQRLLGMGFWMLVVLTIMIMVVILAKKYLAPYDFSNVINFFFVLRKHGILGDISSVIFKTWGRLWLPGLYLIALLAAYRTILYKQERLGIWKSLLIIYVLGNIGGITIVYLSSHGLPGLSLQVKSVYYHFYTVAKEYATFKEVWQMLETFATQEIYRYYSFPMSHPPLYIIWNWILIQITGDSRILIAIILGAAAWTTIVPMFLIGRELYNREFGYYMAGLYAVLPNTLIINHIALDGLITCFFAWAVALVAIGSRKEGHGFMFLGGLAAAGFALTHYSMQIILPVLFVVAVIGLRRMGKPEQGCLAWGKAAIFKTFFFLSGIALPFLIIEMTTHWKFDYLAMQSYVVNAAYQGSIPLHPWFVGSWLAWVNYFIFVGVGVTALFIVRWLEILKGDWRNDALPWAGIITMLVPFVLAIARQETERAYMIFNIIVVATAALALWKDKRPLRYMINPTRANMVPEMGGGWRPVFLWILALSYINSVIIEMLTVDHF